MLAKNDRLSAAVQILHRTKEGAALNQEQNTIVAQAIKRPSDANDAALQALYVSVFGREYLAHE